MIATNALKRSRGGAIGSFENFDMSAFVEASQQVEDSIAFPSIEWPALDDSKEDDYSSPDLAPVLAKRQCRGLVRSKNSSNLSSLSTARFGSAGSLC
jgi:hypothetical protein